MVRHKTLALVAIALLTVSLAGPASARVRIGADLRTEFTYGWENKEFNGQDDTLGLAIFDNALSRISFSYLSDDNRFQAYVEQGVYSQAYGNQTETRQAWFQYNWKSNYIRMGQASDITADYGSDQALIAFNGLGGFGCHDFDKIEQIRLKMGEKYVFKFALQNPRRPGVWEEGGTYHYLPGLAGSAELNFGPVVINPWINYENIQGQNVNAAGDDDSYDALDFGLKMAGDFGLIGFNVGVHYGINSSTAEAVWAGFDESYSLPTLGANGRTLNDSHYIGAWGQFRVENFIVGGGYARATNDSWSNDPYSFSVYANYAISFGMIKIIPEISWFNFGEDENSNDMGDQVLFGIICQMEI